jgi:hypothetical protein
MAAKLKKDSTHKKSSLDGIEGTGGTQKPKTTEQNFKKKLETKNKPGKKV